MTEPSNTDSTKSPGDFDRLLQGIIKRSIEYRSAALLIITMILAWGIWSAMHLSLDVTPDISNVQVQVLTPVSGLSPEEIETSVTRPIELEMFGLPGLEQVRSLTRFGISQVSLIFADGTELYRARQMVTERLANAVTKLPPGLSPKLAPPSSGLGEVFTYALAYKTNRAPAGVSVEERLRQLKLVQEFVVKPRLKSVKGVADVNTTGGYDQQMVVEVDPYKLPAIGMDLNDVATLVQRDVAVGGGASVEHNGAQFIIRSRSRAQTTNQLANICIKLPWVLRAQPLDTIADVHLGSGIRLGAATLNGREAVLGTAMMLTGENARAVAQSFDQALALARDRLPSDMELLPLYDRAELVNGVIETVGHNLAMAAGLVLAVLLVFLRSWRAALIVAAVLVLSFALGLGGMATFGIMGSLLTLGAIDFGVVVDDAIVMVENVSRKLAALPPSSGPETLGINRLSLIANACCEVRKPMLAGMVIIIGAYLPVLTLGGVEGRMFRPLAQSVILLLSSSLLLTVTLVPALCALGLRSRTRLEEPRFLKTLRSAYATLFRVCTNRRGLILALAAMLAAGAVFAGLRLGANFLPYLDEGWLVVEVQRDPGIGLEKSVDMECRTEQAILSAVPEVKYLYSRIGMSEIATDPQGANQNDIYICFRPRSTWRKVDGHVISKAELSQLIESVIQRSVPGQDLELNQPIAVRFDELLEGVRTDLAIKLFGPDYDQLDALANKVSGLVEKIPNAGDVVIDQPGRTAVKQFIPDPVPSVRFMIAGDVMNNAISVGLAGREVGRIDEGDIFYPIVVRIPESTRTNLATLADLPVRSADSSYVAKLSDVGRWEDGVSVGAITREQAQRREAIMVTVNSPDVMGFVKRTQAAIQNQIKLPEGYRIELSGSYKNWESGSRRLILSAMVFVILSAALIYAVLKDAKQTALVALGIPFALIGGIYGLWLRGLPLTMPAVIGFVTLGGLSILNGMVLITWYNELCVQGLAPVEAALQSAQTRLRPVLMTALVASVGFIPMAISTGQGAELQRPFATVVIFGILTSTCLTLIILPLLLAGSRLKNSGPGTAACTRQNPGQRLSVSVTPRTFLTEQV